MCAIRAQAREKTEWLEKRVRGAQQCEQRLVLLQKAIEQIDEKVCANLDQDLFADDLPELNQQLAAELEQQESLLAEIRAEEHDYEAEGRREAANRLHQQLSLVEVIFLIFVVCHLSISSIESLPLIN